MATELFQKLISRSVQPLYHVSSNYTPAPSLPPPVAVQVRAFDDTLIIRRAEGPYEKIVAGIAEVIIGMDPRGRIQNVEIEFLDYYFLERGEARRILSMATW